MDAGMDLTPPGCSKLLQFDEGHDLDRVGAPR